MTIYDTIIVAAAFVVYYLLMREPKPKPRKPKLPYNPNKYKSNSDCRFWGHDWTGWRVVRGGDIEHLQARECTQCGRVQNRIDPYISA